MAYSEQLDRKTYLAGDTVVKWVGVPGMPGSTEPNVGTQYLFVKISPAANDVIELADGTVGEKVVGVTTTKAQHRRTGVAVAFHGRVPVQAGAPLAYGDYVKPGTGGQAVVAATKAESFGVVVEPASAKGVLATIDLDLGKGDPQDTALGDLTDVTVPANTPPNLLLGTTAMGQWGAVPDPLVGHLAAADPHGQYALRGRIGNLLPANQASPASVSGWVGSAGVTLTPVGPDDAGDSVMRVTSTGGSAGVWVGGTQTSGTIPISGGQTYTMQTLLRSSSSVPQQIIAYFQDAGGAQLTTAGSPSIAKTPDWSLCRHTFVAPTGAVRASFRLVAGGLSAGDWVDLKRVGFWEGPGGDWAMPGTPILNQGRRVSRPNVDDRLVETWDGTKWIVTHYDSGWRDVIGLLPAGFGPASSSPTFRLRRIGNQVSLYARISVNTTAATGSVILLIPAGFAAAVPTSASGHFQTDLGDSWFPSTRSANLSIYKVAVSAPDAAAGRTFFGSAHWLTDSATPTSLPGTLITPAP